MPKITYIEHDGTTHTVEAEIGSTVMESALKDGVTGIVAECGGSCTCATCMVYVDEAWLEQDRHAQRGGGGPARLRLRREAQLAPLLPDQGHRSARRPRRAHAGLSGALE